MLPIVLALVPVASGVRDSIGVAVEVASKMGAAGESVRRMASGSFTDAMVLLLLISAIAGVVAAAISGWVIGLRNQPPTPDKVEQSPALARHER